MRTLYEIKTKYYEWCEWDTGWEEFSCESNDLETVAEKYLQDFYENYDGFEYFRSEDDKRNYKG